MEGDEYKKVNYKHFLEDIRHCYKLHEKVTAAGHIYIKIKKGMYCLKQKAILTYNNLKNNMKQYGYRPVLGTTGCGSMKHAAQNFASVLTTSELNIFSKDGAKYLLDL